MSTHRFRHAVATHLLEDGYTHVLNRGGRGVASLLDRLRKPMDVQSGRIIRTDLSHKPAEAGG